jgi:DNA-binding response OmpR family regulator
MKTIFREFTPPKRILYIEDDQDAREMLVWMLKDDGHLVKTATSVAEGCNIAKFERFDLIVLDASFDDGCGVDLCRQIRGFDPFTPIIFYSGSAYPSDIAAGLAAGAQQYLTKPMGICTIRQNITEMMAEAHYVPALLCA